MTYKRALPDVAGIDSRQQYQPLDWVGMNGIHLPTRLHDSINGESQVNASVQAYVNLENTAARGIHMSRLRSEEHTSELQSLMRISYAVFCLKKKKQQTTNTTQTKYKA